MIIGIDIDDTLVSTSESFDRLVKKYNINFFKKWNDVWTEEERNFIFNNYLEEILMDAQLKDDAKEVIGYLQNKGYEIIIITARRDKYCNKIEEKTIKMLKSKDINISQIYFGQNKKSDLAKKLNIDLMVDDNIYVYNNMKEENIDCILFGDKMKTWKEVLEYIESKVK